jgi:hypothetical protein
LILLKEEVLQTNFWTMVDSTEVKSTMNEIVAEVQQHIYVDLSHILDTTKEAVSPNKKEFKHMLGTQEVWASTR